MPLAAPLILPFAELAGITIAGLGMAAASKKVSDFISENPEISDHILTSLKQSRSVTAPGGVGLNALFKKKASVTLEDVEDMTDEEAQDLSDEDIAGVMNEAGKTKGPGKRERMIEISRKLGLSGEGKERKKIIDDIDSRYDEGGVEDAPKPKFDYKKFIRNRNADGGRVPYQSGGILDGVKNIIGEGLDLGAGAGKFLLGAASGIPGAGLLLSGLSKLGQPTISNLAQQNFLNTSGAEVDDLGRLTSGIMQGYNTRFDLSPRARARISAIEKLGLTPERRTKIDSLNEFIAQQEAAQAAAAAAASDSQRAREAFLSISQGEGGYSGSSGPTSAGAGMGVGGGYASDYGFKDGGVITLFVETK